MGRSSRFEGYALRGGRAGAEQLRLLNRVKWPTTEPLLMAAGLQAGMSCLDVGCGSGDVTLKMATLVGAEGSVVGVDRDQSILQLASQEAEPFHALAPHVLYLRAVGRAYVPTCDVASRILYERNKEGTRGCTEGRTGTGVSKKKPADSSRERIGTVGGKLLPVATGVGRGRYWSSSSRRSRLATNVSLAVTEGLGHAPKDITQQEYATVIDVLERMV